MAKFSRKDFISDLPLSIIEMVLTKLPIRDAVRTSILSKEWRYQWATMTQLVFDEKCLSFSDDRQVIEKKLGNFISKFLLLHDGPIHKFKLSTSFLIGSVADLDQWLLFLSRKDIQELDLSEYASWARIGFCTPPCIFSCKKLTKLTLARFEVKPPLGFQGFPCLKYLSLHVSTVTLEVLENLISNCPMLEKLELLDMYDHALTVRAPNLKNLIVDGSFKDLYLEHTPLLVDVAIFFSEDWEGNVLLKVPVLYDCLKFIFLGDINFQEMNQVLYVLQLLLQSPNLHRLVIYDGAEGCVDNRTVDLDFWERKCPTDFTFKYLKSVKMIHVMNKNCMDFIKFVLGRSPVLELMNVLLDENFNEKMNLVNEVLHFQRASPKVDISFFE